MSAPPGTWLKLQNLRPYPRPRNLGHHWVATPSHLSLLPARSELYYINSCSCAGQDLVNFEAGQVGKSLISPRSLGDASGSWSSSVSHWKPQTGHRAMFVEGNVAELMMMQEPSQRWFLTLLIAPFLNLNAASLPFLNYTSTHIQRHTYRRGLILPLQLINYQHIISAHLSLL